MHTHRDDHVPILTSDLNSMRNYLVQKCSKAIGRHKKVKLPKNSIFFPFLPQGWTMITKRDITACAILWGKRKKTNILGTVPVKKMLPAQYYMST